VEANVKEIVEDVASVLVIIAAGALGFLLVAAVMR
jgi:hypothetical protein